MIEGHIAMKTQLKTVSLLLLVTAAVIGSAQSIYKPTVALGDQKMRIKAWGSGTIAETSELPFDGTASIRISSRNFYQGGILIFDEPRDLAAASTSSANMLMLTIQAPSSSTTLGGGASGKGNGSLPGKSGIAGQVGGGFGGTTGRGQQGTGPQEVSVFLKLTLEKVRCVITTSDDKKSEVYFDLTSSMADSKGWKTVGIPLTTIPGFDKSNKMIKSISFSGDAVSTFYIGEMKLKNDQTPIYVEPNVRDLNLALGDSYVFSGYGNAGSTMLKYTWDFNEADGIDVDTEGQTIRRRFMKAGTYIITVTAHDFYGLKASHSAKVKVVVNP